MLARWGLNAGLPVGGDDKVVPEERGSRPGREIWVAGKDPTAVAAKDEGHRHAANATGSCHHLFLDAGDGESHERTSQTMRKVTGEGFTCTTTLGGKEGGTPAPEVVL